MKNLIKNLIFILAIFGFFTASNAVFAAGPSIVSFTADSVTSTGAVLNATVNPNGQNIVVSFMDSNASTIWSSAPFTDTINVQLPPFNLTGLNPGTTYIYKIIASDGINTSVKKVSFTTDSLQINGTPSVVSFTADNITTTHAILNAIVNPHGQTIVVSFMDSNANTIWSSTTFSGNTDIQLPAYNLNNLNPGTTYLYKIIASDGANQDIKKISFTTDSLQINNPAPILTSINPTNGDRNNSYTITLTGNNFNSSFSSVSFGSGVSVTSTTITNQSITANISISCSAATGARNVSVTNSAPGGGTDTMNNAFTVNTGSCSNGGGNGNGGGGYISTPAVSTISATSVSQNGATLNGTVDPNNHATTAWFEYGTSSGLTTANETTHLTKGSGNTAVNLNQNISGLLPNTTYYFRAVANNTYGTKKGTILSFTTPTIIINTTTGSVTTVQANYLKTNGAKLNAMFINQNGGTATGYFEYGSTTSLGSVTNNVNLGTTTTAMFSNTLTTLNPGTIYYFRAVAKKGTTTYKGNILVFKTLNQNVVINSNQNDTIIPTEETEVTEVIEVLDDQNIEINTDKKDLQINDYVNYIITFKNNSSENIENIKITIQLPEGIDFRESDFVKETDNNTIIFEAGVLVSGESKNINIVGKINPSASSKDILITTAIMSYTEANSGLEKNAVAYVTNNVIGSLGLEANSIFGAGFLPSTFIGWIALIFIIILILAIARKMYKNYADKKNDVGNANHIDNLPM